MVRVSSISDVRKFDRLSVVDPAVFYLHRVEADRTEAVYTPGEGADWAAPLLVPDVHLLATCCKHTCLLVMVDSCENHLQQVTKVGCCFSSYYNKQALTLPRIVLRGSSSSPYPGGSIFHCLIVLSSPTCLEQTCWVL